MAAAVIVFHGGCWINDIYEGGINDYIPILPGGISFKVLLSKLESRLKKNTATHTFDIDAIVKANQGKTLRMKVTDEFEWSCLMDMMHSPTLYVTTCVKRNTCTGGADRDVSDADGYGASSLVTSPCGTSKQIRPQNEWSMLGMNKQALIEHDDTNLQWEPEANGRIEDGVVYRSKDSMISAVHAYHFKNSMEFRTVRSSLERYHISCKFGATCSFSMRCKALGKAWKITQLVKHTCAKDIRNCADTKVSARAIAEYVGPSMCEDGFSIRPCDIRGQVLREFGVRLMYNTALNGRHRALKSLYGDEDKSFQMLPKYLFMVKQMNPGSVVDLKTRDDGSFHFCFFCLYASIRAFKVCRPVVVIDATHLRGKYKGVLFVACSKDANEQIVPLAFGVGDKEESESWIWFLEHVKESIGTPEDMLIVSDQHRGIKSAVEHVYPGTHHAFCTFHIQGNLKSCKGWKDGAVDLFQYAAKAYTDNDFNEHMQNLEAASPSAHNKLMAIDPIRWASCKCPVRRYAHGTSNAVESLNSRLKWARKLPIIALMEYARKLAQTWFYHRRNKAGDRWHEVSAYAEKRLDFADAKANSYRIAPISNLKFNISHGTTTNFVDLGTRECSCRVFQLDLLPCSHAIASLRYKKESPIAYVDAYYSTNAWRETYAEEIIPVPAPSDWRLPFDIEARVVGTPANPKQAGRPKTKRISSGFGRKGAPTKDVGRKEASDNGGFAKGTSLNNCIPNEGGRKCARCHEKGHYAGTCTAFLQPTRGAGDVIINAQIKQKRNPKKCSNCGFAGHTRPTCKETGIIRGDG